MIYWTSLYRSYQPINTPYILPTLYAMLYRMSKVLEEPVSSWNILQLRDCDAVVFCCEHLRGMVRAEVNTISSHPHHWGTWYWLQGTGCALGHLWYLPTGRAALPFNILWRGEEEEEESFIGPTEGKCFPSLIIHIYRYMQYGRIWQTHAQSLKGEVPESVSCPGPALKAFGSSVPWSRAPQQCPEGVPLPTHSIFAPQQGFSVLDQISDQLYAKLHKTDQKICSKQTQS